MSLNRRNFIKGTAATVAAMPFTGLLLSASENKKETKRFPIAFFTKLLDGYELEFMAETLAMAGIDGFDLIVRPKGRVEPENVRDYLPKVIETAKKYKLNTEMMVTAITDAKDKFTAPVLKTAAELGIKHYRLGYYDYDFKKAIPESLNDIRTKMAGLAELNAKIGIQGGYQNHAGKRFGAPVWDVWEVIKELSPEYISSQFDIQHAVVEGNSAWIIALHLLSKNIGSLAIKDFTWEVSGGKARVIQKPLGEGIVDFDLYFKTLKELNIVVPITLHVEYPLLSEKEENLSLLQKQEIIVSKVKKDTDFIRTKLNQFQL